MRKILQKNQRNLSDLIMINGVHTELTSGDYHSSFLRAKKRNREGLTSAASPYSTSVMNRISY